jgi:[histone H3]-lysine36 N-trimethyltransferase
MNKYKHKIPRDDLKRFAKEIAKKLVASDYKAGRVQDPTKIEERQVKKVKDFCKQFFDKAYQKHKKHEAEKAARTKSKKPKLEGDVPSDTPAGSPGASPPAVDQVDDIHMSDNDIDDTPSVDTPSEANGVSTLKRKRMAPEEPDAGDEGGRAVPASPSKRLNIEMDTPPPPPPPPPAPPIETPPASTPRDGDDMEMDLDMDIHADTNFKGKSMADVLAQAQAEDADEDAGVDNGDPVGKNAMLTGGAQSAPALRPQGEQ